MLRTYITEHQIIIPDQKQRFESRSAEKNSKFLNSSISKSHIGSSQSIVGTSIASSLLIREAELEEQAEEETEEITRLFSESEQRLTVGVFSSSPSPSPSSW